MFKGLLEFKKNVEARSAGKIVVKAFPASQLGSDEDVVEQIRAGLGVALITDGARMEPYVKEFGILTAPYIVGQLRRHAQVLDVAAVRRVEPEAAQDRWLRDPVVQLVPGRASPRHQQADQDPRRTWLASACARPARRCGSRPAARFGATPTPLAWSEAYSALSMKAIDAVEVQYPSLWGSRIYEVTKFVTKTKHIQLVTGLICSAAWYDKLPADLQKIVSEEAVKAGDYASKITLDSLDQIEEGPEGQGHDCQ